MQASVTERVIVFLCMFVLVCLVAFGITAGILSACSDGKIDYCRADFSDGQYTLWGHANWSTNPKLGRYPTLDEAVGAAKKINCELR